MSESQDLLESGLHHYGLGEVTRAAQIWLELLRREPTHSEAQRYLDYLRAQRPEALKGIEGLELEAELTPSQKDWAGSVPAAVSTGPVATRTMSWGVGVAAPRARGAGALPAALEVAVASVATPAARPAVSPAVNPMAGPAKGSHGTPVALPGSAPADPRAMPKAGPGGHGRPLPSVERSAPAAPAAPVGDPFDLLDPPRSSPSKPPRDALLEGALDLLGLNDFEGSLELVAKAERQGMVDPRLAPLREQCEQQLLKLYESRLGDLHQTPRARVGSGELMWLNLDQRAGFVLSQVDGTVSYDELFALSGMSRLDTARVLAQLVRDGVIGS